MSKPLDPDSAAQAARELLDQRVNVVRELAHVRQLLRDAEGALSQAQADDAAAYRAAVAAGWSDTELKSVGLPKPAAPTRVRRATARRTVKGSAAAAAPSPTAESSERQQPGDDE